MAPDAATDTQPIDVSSAPDPTAGASPSPAPAMPIAPSQTTAPAPSKATFGESFMQSIRGPQYKSDDTGQIENAAPARMATKGGILGAILGGALEGAARGVAAPTPEGARGKGAAFSAGARAAEEGAKAADTRARAIAQQNQENQRAQTQAKLHANLITAQVHDLVQKSQHEEEEFPIRMKNLGLDTEEHQLAIQKALDERRQVMANLVETLEVRGIHPYATISQTPVDGKSMDQQAAPHAASLAQGVAMPIQNGKVGAQNGAALFSKADLDQPVVGNSNDPSTWINVPHYDGTRDNDGNLVSHPTIVKPDGKITYGDVARQFMAADNQLDVLMKKDAAIMGASQKRAELKRTQQETDPLFKLEHDPSALSGDKGPAALATAQARIADPNTSPEDKVRWTRIEGQAKSAIRQGEAQKTNEKAAEMAAIQGNPDAAGKLLAEGTLTLEELKSRQVTPQFIIQATNAAQKYDPTFTAPKAAADARIAGNEANQVFFGNVDSLISTGGTLDQLQNMGTKIPSNKLPVVNSINDIKDIQLGKGPLRGYAATVLGVADDYSKVMTGSVGSDSSRQFAIDLFNPKYSPEQRQEAIDGVRASVLSQRQGRVGDNRYLKIMHPIPNGAIRQSGTFGAAPQTQTAPDPFFITAPNQSLGPR